MKKQQLKQLAKRKISEGKSSQEVFDELVVETNEQQEKIVLVVQNIPTLEVGKNINLNGLFSFYF